MIETIIVRPSVSVREHLIGFRNLGKFLLSLSSVLFMFVRMPLASQLLIGVLYLVEGSVFWDVQDGIIVLDVLLAHSFRGVWI